MSQIQSGEIEADRSYVDFTTPRFGIRVRRGYCRAVSLTEGKWEEYGETFALPLDRKTLNSTYQRSLYDVLMNFADYEMYASSGERIELRALLIGALPFESIANRGGCFSGILSDSTSRMGGGS